MAVRFKIINKLIVYTYFFLLFFAVFGIRIWPVFYFRVSHGYNLNVFKNYTDLKNFHFKLDHFMKYDWWLNIILFMPFPFCLRYMSPLIGIGKLLLMGLLTSVSIELLQYVFDLGLADINDVISNSLGVIIGVLIMKSAGSIVASGKREVRR